LNEQLKRLYDRHAAALRLYARTWCRSPDDALQEAMIELANQSEMPSEPIAWLYRAVRFRAMNLHRSERRRHEREQVVADQKEPFFVQDSVTDIDVARLETALQRLTEQNREIIVARIWGELSFEQIAELTNLSSSSVHRHYRDSLETLKQHLDAAKRLSDETKRPVSLKRNQS
jgi:RNA polymerase sigma-70 factor (ECF subfamily)